MFGYQIHYIVVKMKVIYMQDTIEYFIREKRIGEVEVMGEPEIIDIFDDKDMIVGKYYKFIK